jgi:hypothetical protein
MDTRKNNVDTGQHSFQSLFAEEKVGLVNISRGTWQIVLNALSKVLGQFARFFY